MAIASSINSNVQPRCTSWFRHVPMWYTLWLAEDYAMADIPTGGRVISMGDPKLVGTVKLPTIEDAVKAGGFLAGRPEDIIEQLKAVEKRYPVLDRVICATPLEVQLADLDPFAKEVIPAFRDTRTAAAAQ